MLIKVLIDRLGETCVFRLTFNSLYRLVFFNSIIIIIVPLNSIRVNQIKILLLNIFLIWWLVPLPLGVIVEFDLFLVVALGCLHWDVSLCFLNEFFDCFFGRTFFLLIYFCLTFLNQTLTFYWLFTYIYNLNIRYFLHFLERFYEETVNKTSTKGEPKVNQKSIF